MKRAEREEIFVELVLHIGVSRARKLVDVVAFALRRKRHNDRERPKLRQKRAGPKIRKGFAAMDPVRVSEISSLGGRAAHVRGTAHEYSIREARVAGREGGLATGRAKRRKGR